MTKPTPDIYAQQTMAELHRLGAERDRIREIMAEVYAQVGDTSDRDLTAVFGPPEQFAGDVLAGRRPVRVDYLKRLRAGLHALGVPSERIGEVLAEVDAHVSDTGEDPVSAFGPPGQYAARIAEETGATPQPQPALVRRLLIGALATAGTLVTVEGVVGLVRGHSAPVTVAVLVAAVLVPVLGQAVALLVRRVGAAGCALVLGSFVVNVAVQVVALVWFRQPVVVGLPAWAGVGVGFAAVLAVIVVSRRDRTNLPSSAVTDPRPGAVHGDLAVWDEDKSVPRGLAWGAAAIGLVEIAVLTVVVLLLR